MNVLSLFDGMSSGRIALARAGVAVDNYYASELDKYAIKVTQANWLETIQLGDVTKWRDWDIDFASIDLLTAGFPCQAWSSAGKMQGDSDPRGALVHDLIDIWKHVTALNPNLKFMFENVKMKKEFLGYVNGLFGVEPILINSSLVSAQNRKRYYWTNIGGVEQPDDLGLVLADIIESGEVDRDKSCSSKIRCGSIIGRRINPQTGKRDDYNKHVPISQRLEVRADEKTGTLTTVQKDNVAVNADLTYRKLTVLECERLQTLPDDYTLVLDESGKQLVSNSQRYKMIGNGWTADVIAHIFKALVLN